MNLYQLGGGNESAFKNMTALFLKKAQADPLLADMFAGLDDHAEHIAGFFISYFGGPDTYFRERGDLKYLLSKHIGLKITEEQRLRWIKLMTEAARESGMSEQFLTNFTAYLQTPSRHTTQVSNLDPQQARSMFS